MTKLSFSREERLAKVAAVLSLANESGEAAERARLGVSDEDLALLVDAIDSGELWRLLEQRPELHPLPVVATRNLKWSELLKAARQSDAGGDVTKG